MEKTFNSPHNYKNKRSMYKNKIHKYITVQRIIPKNKKLLIFAKKNKEDKNNNYLSETNGFNKEIKKHRKSLSNVNIPFKKIMNYINYTSNDNKQSLLLIYPNENEINNNSNINKRSIHNYSQKNIFPKTSKNSDINKDVTIISQGSYFTTNRKNKSNIYSKCNNENKQTKNIKKNSIMSKKLIINNIENKNKSKIHNISDKNNNNNKTHLGYRITKDTIFEKENIDPNLFNSTINLGYSNKSKNFDNIRDKNSKIKLDKKPNIGNQTMNIIIRKNSSELLTFGNSNDSFSDSFSKTSNINKNFLLLLKQENDSLKKELMKTKQKVDVLENKIDLLINENNNINNNNKKQKKNPINIRKCKDEDCFQLINDKFSQCNKNKENNLDKTNNKVRLKHYQSQKNFNNDKKDSNKNNNVIKRKSFGRTFSSVFDLKKNKNNHKNNNKKHSKSNE
jgi:hypothetical protein